MQHVFQRHKNRRELFRTIGRWVSFVFLAVMGFLATQRKRLSVTQDDCPKIDLCRGCQIFEHCGLPQALIVKRTKKEVHHG